MPMAQDIRGPSGQERRPPRNMFPPEAEASGQRAYAIWWIRMLFHSLESSALPSLGDQDSLLES